MVKVDKEWHQLRFIISAEKYGWTIQKKAYLHRPIKILQFLTPSRIQKMFNITSDLQAKFRI